MPRYVMVVNRKRCIGCMACVVACTTENNVAEGYYRTKVVETVEGPFPHLRMELRPELCNHCEEDTDATLIFGISLPLAIGIEVAEVTGHAKSRLHPGAWLVLITGLVLRLSLVYAGQLTGLGLTPLTGS